MSIQSLQLTRPAEPGRAAERGSFGGLEPFGNSFQEVSGYGYSGVDSPWAGRGRAGEIHHAGPARWRDYPHRRARRRRCSCRGFLGTYVFGFGDISGFDLRSIAIAVGGALLVLFVYGFVARGRA